MKKKKDVQDEKDPLEKLVKLTKLMKAENVQVAPKGPPRGVNKWRNAEPKFTEPLPKAEGLVRVGEMDVDPARQEEYENWRKDKLAEQADRRIQSARKAEAARIAREKQRKDGY